jgi:hypothetical protein
MALPKIDTPTYELTLPLSKKKVKYRPFTVKEQRNLLLALESDDSDTIQQNVGDILYNCTLTEGVAIDKLPIVDVEYYYLNLRSKSVGEIVDTRYRCNNVVDDKNCNNIMQTQIDLSKVKVDVDANMKPEISLNDKFVVKLKYPEFGFVKSVKNFENVNDLTFNIIAQSIEYIFDGEQYYYASEVTTAELLEFVESLSAEQFSKIENFFNHLPKLKHNLRMTCSKCGFQHNMDIEGLESFFE